MVARKVFRLNMGLTRMEKYLQSCKSEFWMEVFDAELDYILRQLKDVEDILSVGCGPAVIETGLAEHGFNVTGLDISEEALDCAPDIVRTVAGSAEKMGFESGSFDAVIYVASLQFIRKYKQAVEETFRVLGPDGKLLAMLLNPQSDFFREKMKNPDSYINKIKHTDINEIEKLISEYFCVETEYFLGIKEKEIFQCRVSNQASLYVIKGTKKRS